MNKKVRLSLVLALMLTLFATAVQAQSRGSIRGSVREDTNGDGKCADGAAVHGMTLQFKSTHAEATTVYLQSGSDGSYGLVAAGLGNWDVTAMPNADYRITSKKTVSVFIDEDEVLALGVNFCAQKTNGTGTTSTTTGSTVLPQSGAASIDNGNAGMLGLAAALGAMMFVTGGAIELRRRRD